jgi:hypothetical protein
MTDITDTLRDADRAAARLLAQWPDIDINCDKSFVAIRCLEFGVDLRPRSGCAFAFADVQHAVLWYQRLASIAAKSYRLDELHRQADKLYDLEQDINRQSYEFFAAQAIYRLAALLCDGASTNGHRPKSRAPGAIAR